MLLVFMLLINYDLKTLFCLYYTHPPAEPGLSVETLCVRSRYFTKPQVMHISASFKQSQASQSVAFI